MQSLFITIVVELIEQKKKQFQWNFWNNENIPKEKWNLNLIVEGKDSTRNLNEIRSDLKALVIESARECLKNCDHLAEGYPNTFTLTYKINRN